MKGLETNTVSASDGAGRNEGAGDPSSQAVVEIQGLRHGYVTKNGKVIEAIREVNLRSGRTSSSVSSDRAGAGRPRCCASSPA